MSGKVVVYEKAFLGLGAALLVCCLGALLYASAAMGIQVSGLGGRVDPAKVWSSAPFNKPGVRQVGPNKYEVVFVGQIWAFVPAEIRVPAGAEVTFIGTTPDVIHGFHVARTRVNMMLLPGQISRFTYTFDEPGEYQVLCHEYCGAGHHAMFGKLIVEKKEA